jgi:hypothetical protein
MDRDGSWEAWKKWRWFGKEVWEGGWDGIQMMPCLGCPPLDAQIALAVAFALSFSIFSSFSIQIDSDIT